MFRSIKYIVLNNFIPFRRIKFPLDNIYNKNMSIKLNTSEQDVCKSHQSIKRQITEENNEVATKAQKVEATEDAMQKVKRKNFVIMMGYLGGNYFGMQINRGTKTIEESLLTALLEANYITKDQFEDIREIRFQRAARTDKGVSAVRQIVSLKLPHNVNKEDINKHLPKDIRVFGVKRVTKGFNSKNQCDARTYRYVLPTFALAPEHPDFLQLGDEEEVDEDTRRKQLSTINGEPYNRFRLSTKMLNDLNETLKLLEGTHNFHNFTSRTKALDPRNRRYIIYFRCIETFIVNDMEFAVLEVKGQSFMLHQIRKMVTLVIGISRNILKNDFLKEAFSKEKYSIPTAPGLGLSLHFVHYKYYDERYGKDGIHETLDWNECDEEVEKFYREHILKSIIDTEITENVMFNWLASFYTPKRIGMKEVAATCEYIL
nr:PREDICTED: tRNA pseudouridine synthase A, mitochondrial isoform X1 [Megachile rotundata]XP_012149761.1 PREDICTED: tRNA pseudouridine synthase A, mitochondrial isoform X1 [Megachile rotundata]XP_012149762.1 PREDICTED: tRNA pseudouridine synthase A, mitochondrial isoform X1 [Megachile rotundata]XP_012149763.1 PREDICTED: tRNA pseudouridine synthase A, mitochondrial isoform X1 [Megachile rotundata]